MTDNKIHENGNLNNGTNDRAMSEQLLQQALAQATQGLSGEDQKKFLNELLTNSHTSQMSNDQLIALLTQVNNASNNGMVAPSPNVTNSNAKNASLNQSNQVQVTQPHQPPLKLPSPSLPSIKSSKVSINKSNRKTSARKSATARSANGSVSISDKPSNTNTDNTDNKKIGKPKQNGDINSNGNSNSSSSSSSVQSNHLNGLMGRGLAHGVGQISNNISHEPPDVRDLLLVFGRCFIF